MHARGNEGKNNKENRRVTYTRSTARNDINNNNGIECKCDCFTGWVSSTGRVCSTGHVRSTGCVYSTAVPLGISTVVSVMSSISVTIV